MGVGNDGHSAGFYDHLTHVLVDNSLVRRYENSAGFLTCGLRIFVNIRVDRSAYRAQTVVAVCEYARHREFL